jgi:hypothetical protein
MHAIADPPYTRHRLTVDDYYRMAEAGILREDDRVELIEGEIIDMAPIGSTHAGTVKRLANLLMAAVGDTAIVSVQDPVRLGPRSEPQPDIALLRPRADYYTSAHPGPADVLLLVEVADASLTYDRDVKVPLYARHGVSEVWLVDLAGHRLHIHRVPVNGVYQEVLILAAPGRISPVGLPQATVDLTGVL